MSDQLLFNHPGPNRAVITSASGQRANLNSDPPALEAHADGNWSDYLLTPAQQGTSSQWLYAVPAWLPDGSYTIEVFDGASPAVGAVAIGSAGFGWDGSALTTMRGLQSALADAIGGVDADKQRAVMLAFAAGQREVEQVGANKVVTFMAPDGTTPEFRLTFNPFGEVVAVDLNPS